MVRAKFVFVSYTTMLAGQGKHVDGKWVTLPSKEMRTLRFTPVYGNGDPNHENTKFWEASPQGQLELGTVNPEAWSKFELGAEYYLDFTKASPPPETKPAD